MTALLRIATTRAEIIQVFRCSNGGPLPASVRAVLTEYLSELTEGRSKVLSCYWGSDEDITGQNDVTNYLYLTGMARSIRALNSSHHESTAVTQQGHHFVFEATITLLEGVEQGSAATAQCDWDVEMAVSQGNG